MQNLETVRAIEILSNEDLVVASMVFLLLAARINAFFYASPFFGQKTMPRIVKGTLVTIIGILVFPDIYVNVKNDEIFGRYYLILIAKEILLGLVLGVFTWLPIRSLELAGVIMDTQRGATMAQDFEVIFSGVVTPTAQLLAQLFSGFFFASGGLLLILSILLDSFKIWPPGDSYPSLIVENIILFTELAGKMFFSAVALGLMIFGMLFITDIAIALIARTAPTLNALAFASPVKSMVLVFALIFYVNVAFPEIFKMFTEGLLTMQKVFERQGPIGSEEGLFLRGSISE